MTRWAGGRWWGVARPDPVTADPRLLSDDESFRALVRQACALLGCTIESFSGDRIRLYGRITGLVGLADVRRACLPLPRSQWSGVIQTHLIGLARSLESSTSLHDLDAAGPLLRSRLVAPEALPADALCRAAAPGLVEVLVARSGDGVRTVGADAPLRWDLPAEELFARGRRQVLDEGLLERETVDLGGVDALVLRGPSMFTATHAWWLATYLDVGAAGALVALPAQTLVMAHSLRDATALDAVQALLLNANRLQASEPRPLSAGLYWWRDGALSALPAEVTGDRIGFYPPAEFLAVLDQLPPAG
jgi:hypothetical protein